MSATSATYRPAQIWLHWIVVIGVILQIGFNSAIVAVVDAREAGRLVEPARDWTVSGAEPESATWLVWPNGQFTPAKVRALVDWIAPLSTHRRLGVAECTASGRERNPNSSLGNKP